MSASIFSCVAFATVPHRSPWIPRAATWIGSLSVLLLAAAADGQVFTAAPAQIPAGSAAYQTAGVTFADVDNDGDLDAALANGGDCCLQQNRLWINSGGLQGGTLGFFADQTMTGFPVVNDSSGDIRSGDVDGDGDVDLYVANQSDISNQPCRWWINMGGIQGGQSGVFQDQTSTRWQGLGLPGSSIAPTLVLPSGGFIDWSAAAALADFDNDGDLDLFHTSRGSNKSGNVPSRVFLNDGSGAFSEFNPSGFQLSGADIGNGAPGLWCQGQQQTNTTNTTGAFCDIANNASSVEVGDLDADGDTDVLLGSANALPRVYRNLMAEFGSLAFRDVTATTLPGAAATGIDHRDQALADIDGDGDLDLYGVDWNSSCDSLFRNNGAGVFQTPTLVPTSCTNDADAQWLDYDLDGLLDVFVANASGPNRLYRNAGAPGFGLVLTSGELPSGASSSLAVAIGDIDLDGDPDVMIGNANGQATELLTNLIQGGPCSSETIVVLAENGAVAQAPFNVGQPVRFGVGNVTGVVTGYQWRVDGLSVGAAVLKDYQEAVGVIPNPNFDPWVSVPMNAADFLGSEIAFYFKPLANQVHPLNAGPQNRTVSVTITKQGGSQCDIDRVFLVERNNDPNGFLRQPQDFYCTSHKNSGVSRVVSEHQKWHATWGPFKPDYGRQFLLFHSAFLARFDRWRLEFGYPPLLIWDPGTPIPNASPVDDEIKVGGNGSGDPVTRKGTYTPANHDIGTTHPWFKVPAGSPAGGEPTFPGNGTSCAGSGQNALYNENGWVGFLTLDELGCALNNPFHGGVHVDVGGSMASASTAVLDGLFWRWHKFVDSICVAWINKPFGKVEVVEMMPHPVFVAQLAPLPSVTVKFSGPIVGLVAADLRVNGSPATQVTQTPTGYYGFTGFSPPGPGPATIQLGPGIIQDLAGVPFAGVTWSHVLYVPAADDDGDGLVNADEINLYYTDPTNPDTDNDCTSDGTEVAMGTNAAEVLPLLSGCPTTISLATGGQQVMKLSGHHHMGIYDGKLYFMLGTVSGTSPGIPIGSFSLPLNVDGYFQLLAGNPNTPLLFPSLGTLDAAAEATVTLSLPAGLPPAVAGLTLHHAYLVVHPSNNKILAASNALPVVLVP